MLTHLLLLSLTDEATVADRDRIVEGFEELVGAVPGLVAAEVRRDLGLVAGNADLGVELTFEDEDSWRAYSSHPAHLALAAERIKPVLAAKHALQS